MNLDIDPGKILYAVGALFGIAAVLYFARDIVFDLSITVRAVLLLLAFLVLLVAALTTDRSGFTPVLYVLSAAAYLAFLWYTLSRFEIGPNGTFLALAVSAGLFLGLGYLLRERAWSPSASQARWVVILVVIISAGFVAADLAFSEVEYRMSLDDRAEVGERGEVRLGTITAENQFLFREPIDMPRPLICSYGFQHRERPADLRVDGERSIPDTISGGGTVTATLSTRFAEEELQIGNEEIPIETRTTCPTDADGPLIVVVPGEEFPEPPR